MPKFNTICVCTCLNIWVPQHRAVQTHREGERGDGFVSFLTCWYAFQRKRNYGLTTGRGPHKSPIIGSWWSEHAAHDQERQWRWKVIKVTRRVEPCKLNSQRAATPLLDFLLFYYSCSPFFPSFLFHSLKSCCCISFWPLPPNPRISCHKLLSCFSLHLSIIPPAFECFFSSPSITPRLMNAAATCYVRKQWINGLQQPSTLCHTHICSFQNLNRFYLKLLFYNALLWVIMVPLLKAM